MVFGAILNGGNSQRMGADKGATLLAGRSLLDFAISNTLPQVEALAIVGGDPLEANVRPLTHLADAVPGGRGPLAGILAALEWSNGCSKGAPYVFVSAVDTPFLPIDLAKQLARDGDDMDIAFARAGGRTQFMCGLWSSKLAPQLRQDLELESVSSIKAFAEGYRISNVEIEIDPKAGLDPFMNINTPADLERASRLLDLSQT